MARGARKCHVLVVDDEPTNRDLLSRRLQRAGFGVATAGSAAEAHEKIVEKMPAMVLLDICMPEVSGIDFLRRLRADPATRFLPVIMVTSLSESADVVAAIEAGASDYVTKPIDLPVLLARMETHLRMASLVAQLESQTRILAHLAAFDELTGLYNRRSLDGALAASCQRAREQMRALTVLMLDLDHFKQVNDRYGHAAGDAVLREFARRLVGAVRDTDVVGRYGGEEFAVLLPDTDESAGRVIAERIRAAIAEQPFALEAGSLTVTVSIGASSHATGESAGCRGLLEEADQALYLAKKEGRNRVVVFRPPELSPPEQ